MSSNYIRCMTKSASGNALHPVWHDATCRPAYELAGKNNCILNYYTTEYSLLSKTAYIGILDELSLQRVPEQRSEPGLSLIRPHTRKTKRLRHFTNHSGYIV